MCKQFLNIRSKSVYNIKCAFVPCGQCSDCRSALQKDWTTRVKCELEHYHFKRSFNVGFLTLTYNERHLPHVPRRFFKRGEYRKVPCFSYIDVKRFTDGIRNYLFRVHNLTDGYRFFLSSEYGEKKHRPHYHLILMFDKSISHKLMYDVCEDLWCGTENVIPNNPKWKNRKRRHYGRISSFAPTENDKGFVPKDTYSVGSYVAKYVCKDLEFYECVDGLFDHLTKRQKNRLRWFLPFHKQSRSFGSCILDGKSDEEKLKLYTDGIPFVGTRALTPMPRYLKEKLLFSDYKYYNLKAHKEETFHRYSKFFFDNRSDIYRIRFECAKKKFIQFQSEDFWKSKNFTFDNHKPWALAKNIFDELGLDNCVKFYLLYFGVRPENCHILPRAEDSFISRYDPCADLSFFPKIPSREYAVYARALFAIFDYERFCKIQKRSPLEKLLSQVRSFYQPM